MGRFSHSTKIEQFILIAAIISIVTTLSIYITNAPWAFVDWENVFFPATEHLDQPYQIAGYVTPPWLLLFLAPLSLFGENISLAIWLTLSLLLSLWCLHQLTNDTLIIILCLLSPGFIRLVVHGQIDVLILFGYVMLTTSNKLWLKSLGILLMSIKPQVIGLSAIVYWLHAPRKEKPILLLPLITCILLSFFIYGLWPIKIVENMNRLPVAAFNFSPWPYGIGIGLFLIIYAIWKNNVVLGGLATFFLVPYFGSHSLFVYTCLLFTTIQRKWSILIFLLLWIITFYFS